MHSNLLHNQHVPLDRPTQGTHRLKPSPLEILQVLSVTPFNKYLSQISLHHPLSSVVTPNSKEISLTSITTVRCFGHY
jgi:hypothetical protein